MFYFFINRKGREIWRNKRIYIPKNKCKFTKSQYLYMMIF